MVEDNQAHADLIRMSLEDWGSPVIVDHVDDGAKAVEFLYKRNQYADAKRPDFILLDMNLPKLSGHDVLKEVKSNESLLSIPVIIMTTSENHDDITKAYQLHVNSYIVKPTSFEGFQKMISDLRTYWISWNTKAA